MNERKPQINFQVERAMKVLYEEAKATGHWVTRFCAAGFLLLIEDPTLRLQALNRLREWETQFADASDDDVRAFVQGAAAALQTPARGTRRGRATPRAKKPAGRGKSA